MYANHREHGPKLSGSLLMSDEDVDGSSVVAQPFFEMMDGAHTVDYRPSIESQLASKQLTSWPYVVTLPPQCGGAAVLRDDGR